MNVTVRTTTTKVVEETTQQQVALPYYGHNGRGNAMVSVYPQMWAHLPERIQRIVVREAITTQGKGSQVKVTYLNVASETQDIPAGLLAYVGKYPTAVEAAVVETHTATVLERVLQGQ